MAERYRTATVAAGSGAFGERITVGPHPVLADLPADLGGDDAAPDPHDYLLVALGACTAMTVRMYARRKGWPLVDVKVELTQHRDGAVHRFNRTVHFEGALTDEQRERLLDIANKCPVHKTLSGEIAIETKVG